MREFLQRVPVPGTGTFFCTQRYACLEATGHELCPHPLLDAGLDWEAELLRFRQLFPQARGWRSHSCVFSHSLALRLGKLGYDYVSTHDEFGARAPVPHRHAWGVWQLPVYYMDTLDFCHPENWPGVPWEVFDAGLIRRAIDGEGVFVFDFHPIHLLLNTSSTRQYMSCRDDFRSGRPIEQLQGSAYGSASFYAHLLDEMARAGLQSVGMADALPVSPGRADD